MLLNVAKDIMRRVEILAEITAYPWTLTRRIFTPEHLKAEALVHGWMEEAGLTVRRDPAGNLIGRIEGSIPGGPAIVIGGHIDTAENACRYDGVLGVLMGIACIEHLVREGRRSRSAIEVVAFVNDAAGRFGGFRLGSRAMTGGLSPDLEELAYSDPYDVTLRQAMQAYGLDPEHFEDVKRDPSAVATYIEVLAEPGPVLERADSPVGIVDALTLSALLRVTLTGVVGQAATLPMAGRRDALAGAAECVIEAERIGSARPGVTGTTVRFEVEFVPSFAVLGSVRFGVIFASRDDEARWAAVAEAESLFRDIAGRRGLEILVEKNVDRNTKRCDPAVVRAFEMAAQASGQRATVMGTEGSHAFPLARFGPIGVLLIRARGSTGWGPGAEVRAEDIAAGLEVLSRAVRALAGPSASLSGEGGSSRDGAGEIGSEEGAAKGSISPADG